MPATNTPSPSVADLQERYTDLERRIHALWPAHFRDACSRCTRICCRPHMFEDILSSDWLCDIGEKAYGPWWQTRTQANTLCPALDEDGCILAVGKHPFCRYFSCDMLLDASPDGPTLIADLFLSGILIQVCRIKKGASLLQIPRHDFARYARDIDAALTRGETEIRLCEAFSRTADPNDRERLALRMVALRPAAITPSATAQLAKRGFFSAEINR
ncbi:MAG: hypothetical protein GX146_05350 [Myxococcales bacterium]|jgi:hypothetical protein|nr:hypothetical protein [Myxococcales bacterium]